MSFPAFLDACVLLPYQLCDLLLRLAESNMYRPLWSEDVLVEVERNLVTSFGKSPQQAERRVRQMRSAFPLAGVEHYEDLTPAMTNHPKDRHVLAAAVRGGAAVLVTANVSDFPAASLLRHDIEAVHPDAFLLDQLDLDPPRVLHCLAEQQAAYEKPKLSSFEFYDSLRRTVPRFAEQAQKMVSHVGGTEISTDPAGDPIGSATSPLPLEIVSDEDVHNAFFPDGEEPAPRTPIGAAFLWFAALLNLSEGNMYLRAVQNLSYNPADWNDYKAVAAQLAGWALMQNVHYCDDAPDKIAYVKLMPDTGWSMRAFDVNVSSARRSGT